MLERFTERARRVVVMASEEARGFKHDSIGTEHILLGLVSLNDGAAARILLDLDASPKKIRGETVAPVLEDLGVDEAAVLEALARTRRT